MKGMMMMEALKKNFLVEEEVEEQEGGELDWAWMFMPRLPWSPPQRPPPFYKVNQKISWVVATVMGFQHALAMIGGIVSVPLLLAGPFDARMSNAEQEYLISAGLIVSGILSMIQITQFKLGNSGYFLGTGLISVLGTSFTFVPIARTSFSFMMNDDSSMPCASDFDCTDAWADMSGQAIPGETNAGQCNLDSGFCKNSGQAAYGAFLGTCVLCCLLEVFMSFLPRQMLKRAFPPMVTGVCVLLIGVGLTGTGMKYWGGGVFCGDHYHKRMRVIAGEDLPGDWTANYPSKSPCVGGACVPFSGSLSGICAYTDPVFDPETNMTRGDRTTCESFMDLPGIFPAQGDVDMSTVKCSGNGEVVLPFGSPEYVGLGFGVFGTLLLIEMFGSPFLRNCEVAVALLVGFLIAGVSSYTPEGASESLRFVTPDRINQAPAITFLWVETFPLSVYAPAIFPLLLSYVITAVETIGDVTASCEASKVESEGERFDGRVQGGLLADGVCSILGCLGTSPPNTTFSQNSGVISLTRCANKRAGYMCAFFLILFGVFAKISAIIASIPDCVLGGMTTFLFVNIVTSGLSILGPVMTNRRSRFIVAASLAIGIGVAIVPQWVTNNLIKGGSNPTTKLINDSFEIVVSTPYCIGTLIAMFLHAIIPEDKELADEEDSLAGSSSHESAANLEVEKLQTVTIAVQPAAMQTGPSYPQEAHPAAIRSELSYAEGLKALSPIPHPRPSSPPRQPEALPVSVAWGEAA